MTDLRLVIFDIDGTLVDSRAGIVGAMVDGFTAAGLPVPPQAAILATVGLSLEVGIAQLSPGQSEDTRTRIIEAYRTSFRERRLRTGRAHSPFFPGMEGLVRELAGEPETLLGIATGKSRRGVMGLLEVHGLEKTFLTIQMADEHPSKPHPSMIMTAMVETGVDATRTVMIGDASFDIDMARSAGVHSIGVGWGFQPVTELAHADRVAKSVPELAEAIDILTLEKA